MDPYRQNGKKDSKKTDEGTSNLNTEGRWGSWAMGTPAPTQAYPSNQNANYMYYTAPPVTDGNASGVYGGSSMPQPANPYVQTSTGSSGKGPMDTVLNVLSRCGKKVEVCAKKADGISGNVWNHLKTSPSLSDAAMARLSQGTKVFAEGGREKVFQQTFQLLLDEKLLKAYACYLSSSSGPVIGTLYISNKRVAFCSDNPLCHYPTPGQKEWLYYKVAVPIDQLVGVNPSSNRLNPSEKYIEVITVDGHEFWFMGFVSYDKALKNLSEALQQYGAFSSGNLQN